MKILGLSGSFFPIKTNPLIHGNYIVLPPLGPLYIIQMNFPARNLQLFHGNN